MKLNTEVSLAIEAKDGKIKTFIAKENLKQDGFIFQTNGITRVWVKNITLKNAEEEARKLLDMGLKFKFCATKYTYGKFVRSLAEVDKEIGVNTVIELRRLENAINGVVRNKTIFDDL